jgi:hypothetical protein
MNRPVAGRIARVIESTCRPLDSSCLLRRQTRHLPPRFLRRPNDSCGCLHSALPSVSDRQRGRSRVRGEGISLHGRMRPFRHGTTAIAETAVGLSARRARVHLVACCET